MYPYTKVWIPTSHNIQILSGLYLSRTVAIGQCHRPENSRWRIVANRCIQIPNLSSMSYHVEDMLSTRLLDKWGRRSQLPKSNTLQFPTLRYIQKRYLRFLPQIMLEIRPHSIGKSGTNRESNQASGARKAHYA